METVAFFGAGLLGANFVKAMRKRGLNVHVWNRTFEKAQALEADGAKAFRDAAEAARGVDRIHICTRDDAAVDAILDAMFSSIEANVPVIDHTTVSPEGVVKRAKRFSDASKLFIHCPVFMGPPAALNAAGSMLASGPKDLFETVRPALEPMTGQVRYLGERVDLAAVYKLMGNATLLALYGGVADVLRMADAQGVPRTDAMELFSFFNPAGDLGGRGKRMSEGDYSAYWTVDMARKDANLMLKTAKDKELDVIAAVEQELGRAMSAGLSEKDFGAIASL